RPTRSCIAAVISQCSGRAAGPMGVFVCSPDGCHDAERTRVVPSGHLPFMSCDTAEHRCIGLGESTASAAAADPLASVAASRLTPATQYTGFTECIVSPGLETSRDADPILAGIAQEL